MPNTPYVYFYLLNSTESRYICQDGDLNPGHEDFQSSALPTELSRLVAVFYLGNLTNIANL